MEYTALRYEEPPVVDFGDDMENIDRTGRLSDLRIILQTATFPGETPVVSVKASTR